MASRRDSWIVLLALGLLLGGVVPLRAADPVEVTVAHIRLAGSLDEAPVADDPLFGGMTENLQIKIDRIKKAQADKKVQALLLQIDGLDVGFGKLHELKRAIADFRKSGKKAYAYLESDNTKDYLLALSCDEVALPEAGTLMLTGLRGQVSFYKDLLDKIGIKADMLQMGDYKGAAEPLTRSSMSQPFRERLESVLDDDYDHELLRAIVRGRARRQLTPSQVKRLIDEGPYTAKAALAAGLVDQLAYVDQFQDSIKTSLKAQHVKVIRNYAQKKPEEIDFSDLFSILKLFKPPKIGSSKAPKIAVVYATGIIIRGKSSESLFGEQILGSTTLIKAIRQAEKDATVKAIVLRVDSPGGSALASDLIWNELNKSKKPVVASMSDTAASGGYYISMAARKIYAEPGTLTGSIGVVGGKLVLGGLFHLVGVKTEIIKRGAHADIMSSATPWNESERKAMKSLMEDVYDQFVSKAMQGRVKAGKKFKRADFLKFAEGRIWTGRQAKLNGLVDELGTLEEAIAAAKQMAGLDKSAKTELLILPKPKSFIEMLLGGLGETRSPQLRTQPWPILHRLPELGGQLRSLEGLLQLRGEPVWAVLPCRIEVR